MKLDQFYKLLELGSTVYLLDEFEEAVFCIVPQEAGHTTAYLKRIGRKEIEVERSLKIVGQAILGGVLITKEQYERY